MKKIKYLFVYGQKKHDWGVVHTLYKKVKLKTPILYHRCVFKTSKVKEQGIIMGTEENPTCIGCKEQTPGYIMLYLQLNTVGQNSEDL